ncbi:hypothetical protein FOXB_01356 [Fusarium oxysporum f. sp. conglutinans Fo5176]|uniref:Uncharacterized protein n=1 Tax=Fusarium oxysporum (strain Fo5176) TaxID=660025 RepID=F9F4N1_FUSOF|nr:hypothetical protein FOXB_01356 [Fusarium oxysporum f. sp. conglutinans Fo5176]
MNFFAQNVDPNIYDQEIVATHHILSGSAISPLPVYEAAPQDAQVYGIGVSNVAERNLP